MKTYWTLFFCVLIFASLYAQDSVIIKRLPDVINTDKNEIHPIPFGDDILYYSSNFNETFQIYRTEKMGGTWKEPLKPAIFGMVEKKHFQGGSFTPNKSRFYFSQCDSIDGKYQCEIYVMQRDGKSWSKPKKLPEYINKKGCTTLDPFVHVVGGQEILYFSSDRKGGRGGKDIWFAVKDYDSKDLDFDQPINLGKVINTKGDEISPYVDRRQNIFYFSSNGQKNKIGNLDIYKTKGLGTDWQKPILLKVPINSKYDDAYFRFNLRDQSGYFSSNRSNEARVNNRKDYDLYYSKVYEKKLMIEGQIYEKGNSEKLLQNVKISLFEVTNTGEYALTSNISPDGYYSFSVRPNRRYKIELEHRNHYDTVFYLLTNEEEKIVKNLPFQKIGKVKIQGKIQNTENISEKITDIKVELFEARGQKRGLQHVFATNGEYTFQVDANQTYVVKLKRGDTYVTEREFTVTEKDTAKAVDIDFLILTALQEIELKKKEFNLTGIIHDALKTDILLDNVNIIISELTPDDRLIFKREEIFSENYSLELNSTKNYKISLSRDGYISISFLILGSIAENRNWAKMDFYLFPK